MEFKNKTLLLTRSSQWIVNTSAAWSREWRSIVVKKLSYAPCSLVRWLMCLIGRGNTYSGTRPVRVTGIRGIMNESENFTPATGHVTCEVSRARRGVVCLWSDPKPIKQFSLLGDLPRRGLLEVNRFWVNEQICAICPTTNSRSYTNICGWNVSGTSGCQLVQVQSS